jgi:prevent-host-death family protein
VRTVNIHEAKTHLARYVEQAAKGEEIIIAKAGRPIARLVALAPEQRGPRKLGIARDQLKIPEDFDQAHAEEIRKMVEGEDQT